MAVVQKEKLKYLFHVLNLMLLEDDDDDDDEEYLINFVMHDQNPNFEKRRVKLRAETTLSLYSLSDFKTYFRLEKTTFAKLLNRIGAALTNSNPGRPKCPKKQLLICLWMLGNQEPLRTISDRFDVAKSTARLYVLNVSDILVERAPEHIKWPDARQATKLMAAFKERTGFPGILGAIDSIHIPIATPQDNAASYVCHKGHHSIILQGICDHNKRFIDCYAGMPGSFHDAGVLKASDIYEKLNSQGNTMLPNDTYLVGDSAYPLTTFLMKPYQDNGHLTQKQQQFNYKLSLNRMVIEQAFSLLKGRFRFLNMVNILKTELIPKVILACCVLHNICIDEGDDIEVETEETHEEHRKADSHECESSVRARHKRNIIANQL